MPKIFPDLKQSTTDPYGNRPVMSHVLSDKGKLIAVNGHLLTVINKESIKKLSEGQADATKIPDGVLIGHKLLEALTSANFLRAEFRNSYVAVSLKKEVHEGFQTNGIGYYEYHYAGVRVGGDERKFYLFEEETGNAVVVTEEWVTETGKKAYKKKVEPYDDFCTFPNWEAVIPTFDKNENYSLLGLNIDLLVSAEKSTCGFIKDKKKATVKLEFPDHPDSKKDHCTRGIRMTRIHTDYDEYCIIMPVAIPE